MTQICRRVVGSCTGSTLTVSGFPGKFMIDPRTIARKRPPSTTSDRRRRRRFQYAGYLAARLSGSGPLQVAAAAMH
jgi:hypothetical protein